MGDISEKIRIANRDDLPGIVSIYNQTIPSRLVTADTDEVSVESRTDWFNAHNPDTRPLWVIMEENEMMAWVSYQSFYGRPAYNATAELSIYIDGKHRGKGLGNKLLGFAMEQAPGLGIKNILGFIFGHNEPSLNLFYKFGFQQWGFFPGVAILEGLPRDLVILGKKLD
jgi:L-amino acid N-acyltransferase YncA